MFEKNKTEELCSKILEENGGLVADRARTILLEDPVLRGLRPPLEFIAQSWRDPLTPALVNLSCMAVDGHKNKTYEAALAMSLITLSCNIWDDIVDETSFRLFKPTLREKFGETTALMIGGLASAKAFSMLDQLDERMINRHNIVELIWEFCAKIAKAETVNLRLRSQRNVTPRKRLWVIKAQAINLETCMKIGARIGCGSETQVEQLGKYGLYLSTILELWKDFHVSVNLTL